MVSFEELKSKQEKICVVGLGYVGLPLTVQLAKHFKVTGFDINLQRINDLKQGIDCTNEVSREELDSVKIEYTNDPRSITEAKFIIIAVPTPIDEDKKPDLNLIEKSSQTVGQNLGKGSVVVYESTVYPGVTEEVCLPILERESGLKVEVDFKVGYSPERVNPGDKDHTIDKITKVVAGMDDESTQLLTDVYGTITKIFKANSIKVAEAAKVIENTQRDLNIALMNELAILFKKMNISVYDVLEAAGTKWNFLKLKPGLVGGHCIGVDPYYLTYKAQELGYDAKVILAGRGVNDQMPKFIAQEIVAEMKNLGREANQSQVVILGITFKENIIDTRNSKAAELCRELESRGLKVDVYDPLAIPEQVEKYYGLKLCEKKDLPKADALIVAVAHDEFKNMSAEELRSFMNDEDLLLVDIKRLYNRDKIEKQGINYWTL